MKQNHYFDENPVTPHKLKTIEFSIRDKRLLFTTDTSVFSKDKVDYGSKCLIKSMPKLSGRILDLGCGYGTVGLSLALLNPDTNITMVDINSRAIDLAITNANINGIKNVDIFSSDGFTKVNGLYNAIVSNPPIRAGKKVIYPLFEQSIYYLKNGGSLYLVIQKKQGAKSATEKLIALYGNCHVVNKSGGYWILKSTKS